LVGDPGQLRQILVNKRTAHTLQGEVGLLGAKTAYNLAAKLATMGSIGHMEGPLGVLQEIERELERVILFFDHAAEKPHG